MRGYVNRNQITHSPLHTQLGTSLLAPGWALFSRVITVCLFPSSSSSIAGKSSVRGLRKSKSVAPVPAVELFVGVWLCSTVHCCKFAIL